MPIAKELTDVFLDLFNEKNTRGLIKGLSSGQPYGPTRPINKEAIAECFERLLSFKAAKEQNYETVLSHLQDDTAKPAPKILPAGRFNSAETLPSAPLSILDGASASGV
jgi:hypothetical protein